MKSVYRTTVVPRHNNIKSQSIGNSKVLRCEISKDRMDWIDILIEMSHDITPGKDAHVVVVPNGAPVPDDYEYVTSLTERYTWHIYVGPTPYSIERKDEN